MGGDSGLKVEKGIREPTFNAFNIQVSTVLSQSWKSNQDTGMCLSSSVRAADHFLGILHCPGQCPLWSTGFQCPHNCPREALTLDVCRVTGSVACTLPTMESSGLSKLSAGYWTVGDSGCSIDESQCHVSSAGPRWYCFPSAIWIFLTLARPVIGSSQAFCHWWQRFFS